MTTALIIGAIILAIVLGYKFKINIGFLGIMFAYLIGGFVLQIKPSAIIAMWPTNLFFFLFAVTFFYGFAFSNGTLIKFSRKAIYACRNKPYLIPIMLYIVTFALSGVGPGGYAVFAFLAPVVMAIASETKMNKVLAAVIIVGGGVAGGYTPISLGYAGIRANIATMQYSPDEISNLSNAVARNNILAQVILFVIVYFLLKGYKVKTPEKMEKPDPFDKNQRLNLILIGVGLLVTALFPVLCKLFSNVPLFTAINGQLDTGLISIVLAVIAMLLKVGDEKKALACVPWGTIILISGMGMLIAVAVKSGAIDLLSNWISQNVSAGIVPYMVAFVAGGMSFFASAFGVVMPTMYSIIPGIVAATGAPASVLFSIVMVAGHFTGFSPFSTGGAMALIGVTDEKEKNKLFFQLMVLAVASIVLACVLMVVGIIR